MVLGGVLRSVAGWKADKYQFEVTIHSAYNLLPGTKALQVQWKRGTKSTATKPVKAQRGEALWDEELSLVCTMFVNPKTSTYEPKPAVFVVREILDAPLKERVYAEAVVDLLEFAMQPGRTIRRTLPLAQGKKTLPSHIIFSVKATPLREGVALSEVSSNVSVADLAEVEEADAPPEEPSVFEQHRRQAALARSKEALETTTQSRVVTTTLFVLTTDDGVRTFVSVNTCCVACAIVAPDVVIVSVLDAELNEAVAFGVPVPGVVNATTGDSYRHSDCSDDPTPKSGITNSIKPPAST